MPDDSTPPKGGWGPRSVGWFRLRSRLAKSFRGARQGARVRWPKRTCHPRDDTRGPVLPVQDDARASPPVPLAHTTKDTMTAPFRFVHTADLHLDGPVHSSVERLRRQVDAARRTALQRLTDVALQQRVDAFLVAGDLIDESCLTLRTEAFLTEQLARMADAGISVVVAAGNADPGREGGRLSRVRWPHDVHLVDDAAPVSIDVKRNGKLVGRVVAVGHRSENESGSLIADMPEPQGDVPTVALCHALIAGSAGSQAHARVAPATPADLAARPYAYWALGHVHQRQQIGDAPAWYAGPPQSSGFSETGRHGALLVSCGDATKAEFIATGSLRFEVLRPEGLAGVHTEADLQAAVELALEGPRTDPHEQDDTCWAVRIELAGPCGLTETLRRPARRAELAGTLAESLGVAHVELLDSGLTKVVDPEAHRDPGHLLGQGLDLLDEARHDDRLLQLLIDGTGATLDSCGGSSAAARKARARDLLGDLPGLITESLLKEDDR